MYLDLSLKKEGNSQWKSKNLIQSPSTQKQFRSQNKVREVMAHEEITKEEIFFIEAMPTKLRGERTTQTKKRERGASVKVAARDSEVRTLKIINIDNPEFYLFKLIHSLSDQRIKKSRIAHIRSLPFT